METRRYSDLLLRLPLYRVVHKIRTVRAHGAGTGHADGPDVFHGSIRSAYDRDTDGDLPAVIRNRVALSFALSPGLLRYRGPGTGFTARNQGRTLAGGAEGVADMDWFPADCGSFDVSSGPLSDSRPAHRRQCRFSFKQRFRGEETSVGRDCNFTASLWMDIDRSGLLEIPENGRSHIDDCGGSQLSPLRDIAHSVLR